MSAIFVSDRTLAGLLDCSTTTIWRRVKDGSLPAPIKFGGITRFDAEAALAAFAAADASRRRSQSEIAR